MNRRQRRENIRKMLKVRQDLVNVYKEQFKPIEEIAKALNESDVELLQNGTHPNSVFQEYFNKAKSSINELAKIDLIIAQAKTAVTKPILKE